MPSVIDATSLEEPVVTMSRVFDAPRDLVWKMFTDPAHVAHWYGGHGFTNPVCEMDVRPGGLWRHVMRSPDGAEYAMTFVFLEVDEPERIVWKHADHDSDVQGGPPTSIMTVTLEDLGDRTRWTLVSRFKSMASRDLAKQMGFSNIIEQGADRIAAYLKTV
jgi:uncharacterized protein YndB with AHSA1/START domain